MNRRMAKAKAARKFHAARRRRILRRGVTITISFDCDATALAFAMLGDAARQAAHAFRDFGQAMANADAIDGECTRVPRRTLELQPGQLYLGGRDGGKRYVGETGPIRLRLGHDPLPGQVLGCTCTVERVTKTDSQGQLRQVDIPSPPCAWCLDLEDRAAAEGFGLEPLEACGTCGELIVDDDMTGTTCACARRP